MVKPRALILRTAGTNCDFETDFAFRRNGADVDKLHINRLIEKPSLMKKYSILALAGGFSYGDYISAGKITSAMILHRLRDAFHEFTASDKLIVGICNGFQILVKTGILPDRSPVQTATLMNNDSGSFVCKWTRLIVNPDTIFTKGLPHEIILPVAHAEGKFYADIPVIEKLEKKRQVAFRYAEPLNGSVNEIAGITDPSGRVLGMMPHPERFCIPGQAGMKSPPLPAGDLVFRNMVFYFS
jgi:phosphoribosylformylglycinamidine synthase